MSASISIIIPAYNEEAFIGQTLDSINLLLSDSVEGFNYEVIVVDNGSTDRTRGIALSKGAKVLDFPVGTIAAVRNFGVRNSTGKVLVFLDADVCLTSSWVDEFKSIYPRLLAGEKFITGSQCAPPDSNNWLLKYWFRSFYEVADAVHLGSAHLIMSSVCFNLIGGFDPEKETGEDYDICRQCVDAGYHIENNLSLLVYHNDFPTNVVKFMKREAWHGIGDYSSLESMMSSKVAQVTLIFVGLHILGGYLVFTERGGGGWVVCMLLLILSLTTCKRFGFKGLRALMVNSGISYFYFLGRALSPFMKLRRYFKSTS